MSGHRTTFVPLLLTVRLIGANGCASAPKVIIPTATAIQAAGNKVRLCIKKASFIILGFEYFLLPVLLQG